jgi:hypothetical protein
VTVFSEFTLLLFTVCRVFVKPAQNLFFFHVASGVLTYQSLPKPHATEVCRLVRGHHCLPLYVWQAVEAQENNRVIVK